MMTAHYDGGDAGNDDTDGDDDSADYAGGGSKMTDMIRAMLILRVILDILVKCQPAIAKLGEL